MRQEKTLKIAAGYDQFQTVPGLTSFELPPFPAGFFGENSDEIASPTKIPFTGAGIGNWGLSAATAPFHTGGIWSSPGKGIHCIKPARDFTDKLPLPDSPSEAPDTLIQRQAVSFDHIGDRATTAVKIIGLALVSALPLSVTYGGGQRRALFTVIADLAPPDEQKAGEMTLERTGPSSGKASSTLPVRIRLRFVNIFDAAGPAPNRSIDIEIKFVAKDAPWIMADEAERGEVEAFFRQVVEHVLDHLP